MNADIKIEWSTDGRKGSMQVHLDAFFPTSQRNAAKLFQWVLEDWKNEEQSLQTLDQFFQEEVHELETEKIPYSAKKHLEYKQKVSDLDAVIKEMKHPNGVPVTKDELVNLKEELKVYKQDAAGFLKDFRQFTRRKEGILKNQKTFETMKQRK